MLRNMEEEGFNPHGMPAALAIVLAHYKAEFGATILIESPHAFVFAHKVAEYR